MEGLAEERGVLGVRAAGEGGFYAARAAQAVERVADLVKLTKAARKDGRFRFLSGKRRAPRGRRSI
jgi:hypothetical protein